MRLTSYLKIFVSGVFICMTTIASGQTPQPVQLDVDHAAFAYSDDESLVEIYLAFEAATLTYQLEDRGFVAVVPVEMKVIRSSHATLDGTPSDPIWQDSVDLSFVIADTTDLREGQHFIHQIRLTTPPGEYELNLEIIANESAGTPAVQIQRDLIIPDFSDPNRVNVSDVTLAVSIEPSSDHDDLFYKNGLLVRPNANQIFGSGLDRLFYYVEVYGLDQMESTTENYSTFTYIAEANVPQPMADYQKRSQRKISSPDVLVGSFDIGALPSGSYFFRLAILNENNAAVIEQSRKFFIYNPLVERVQQTVLADESFETSRYASMPIEEVEMAVQHIDIIATEAEKRRIRGIKDLDERRRFLMDFWKLRDPNPRTPINEFQEDFNSRLQYASDRYTTNFEEGWNTDRGRTLIKYGTPSAIEPHLYDRDMRPHEIWEYNNIPGEGQAIFIFADVDGFGMFEMIHSTVSGERKLANWQRELVDL